MKHIVNSREVPLFSMAALIIVVTVMTKTGQANWFCENQDCRWSVALFQPEREGPALRCVCGWPLRRVAPPVVSTYLGFLRHDETLEKERKPPKE